MPTKSIAPTQAPSLTALPEACQQYGTPLYVYDSAIMARQYQKLTEAFAAIPQLRINYACKALSNLNVLRFFKKMGSGLDTVSIQEVELGLKAGFAPEEIIYTPNGVSFAEVQKAVEYGVRVNIDNLGLLEHFGSHYGHSYPVCIRINPHIMAGGNAKISVGHIDSKFGISIHQTRHLERLVESLNLRVEGVHMHTGSDILDVDTFLSGAELLLEVARKFPDLQYIDFGSGFKVPYQPGDIATDVEELGAKMGTLFAHFCRAYGRTLSLEFEPGKYLVSEAGYFCCQVNGIKQTTATVFAQVDTGLNHLIRPMLYDAHHDIYNLSNPNGRPRVYSVVGYICETDTFASDRQIPEVREGDLLAFANAGAYCYTMANNYNSRYRPAEVLLHEGEAHLIRQRESMEDLLRNQIDLAL
ncbi:MAG: diaminopimelate decarboxylase [Schleiferiaceae bacterium]|nr:diaminopimelate decarboxylase [Schleiferiaceae bacterium]MDR9441296.1 diaminopimelate decarboxylase [Schleiferiaceae bacterium]